MKAILRKELADHFSSIRVLVLFLLVLIASFAAILAARGSILGTGADKYAFLKLFTASGETIPSLIAFVDIFIPIIGITLGFDAINREHNSNTLSRIASQPVYRDSIINGKFLSGIVILSMTVVSALLLVSGYGLRLVGVPPTAEEIIRLYIYLIITVVYGGFWLGLAMLFSVLFRKQAVSLLLSLFTWLSFTLFIRLIAPLIAGVATPINAESTAHLLSRISPGILFREATVVLLVPSVRSLGAISATESSFMIASPLNLGQSISLIWPHLTVIISLSAVCFAVSYLLFMRQEIRAT